MKSKILPFVVPLGIVLLWWVLSVTKSINPFYVPYFPDVVRALIDSFGPEGLKHIGLTFYRMFAGFIITGVVAVPLGLLIGMNRSTYRSLEIVIDFYRSVPATALIPLFLLFFGLGDGAKIAQVIFICFWVILVNTIYGVWNSSALRIRVAHVFKVSKMQLLRDVIFWGALPQIMVGLRIALSLALLVIVVSEMFVGTEYGIGQKIYDSYITYKTAYLYAYILIVGMLGYAANKLFLIMEQKVVHWAGK